MRLHRLDGLRGLAALIVVFHHSLLTVPQLAAAYYDEPVTNRVAVALVRTPLHLLWEGSAAVTVFFVLSGFVLTLATQGQRVSWLRFDLQRLIRLYLPVWGSTVLAVAFAVLIRRHGYSGHNAWMAEHDVPILRPAMDCLTLLHPSWLNSPLWSLRWEVVFSLLLPLYLLAGRLSGKLWPLVPFACAFVGVVSAKLGMDAFIYLPQFLSGVVITQNLDTVKRWATRVGQAPLVAVALALIALPWALANGTHQTLLRAGVPVIAASLLLAACLTEGRTTSFLARPWAQWLGRISFSLYLTHEPLVVSLAVLGVPGPLVPVLATPLALVVAAAFYRFVERPAHVIAKRVSVTTGSTDGRSSVNLSWTGRHRGAHRAQS